MQRNSAHKGPLGRISRRSVPIMLCVVVLMLPALFIQDSCGHGLPLYLRSWLTHTPLSEGNCSIPEAHRNSACPEHDAAARNQLQSSQILLREYETASGEIRTRLEQEYLLFGIKLSAVGAILAIILSANPWRAPLRHFGGRTLLSSIFTSESACFCSWAAVCACTVIDVRSQYILRIVVDLGSWIRQYVEACLMSGNSPVLGWETYWLEHGAQGRFPLVMWLGLERRLLTFFLFAVSLFAFVVRPIVSGAYGRSQVKRVLWPSRFFVPTILFLMGMSELYAPADDQTLSYIFGCVASATLVSAVCMYFITKWVSVHFAAEHKNHSHQHNRHREVQDAAP